MWRTTRLYFRAPILSINDLPQCLDKTKPRLFADDANLTVSGDSIADLETAVTLMVAIVVVKYDPHY